MPTKTTPRKKVTIQFDEEHLKTLTTALEVYSRLRSGQISIAMDSAFWDANISWVERQYLENMVRYTIFPAQPKREYDGHGGFYDQYNNEYDEIGTLVKESDYWKSKKNRHHLDHSNSYYGVGCEEMKDGTVAWEIKKTIEQYLHYQENSGYRNIMDVSGDGPMQISEVPVPKVLNFDTSKTFPIPKKKYNILNNAFRKKDWKTMWDTVDLAFKNNPLPKGKSTTIEKENDQWFVIVKEPYVKTAYEL
jgi:hypothetical protein